MKRITACSLLTGKMVQERLPEKEAMLLIAGLLDVNGLYEILEETCDIVSVTGLGDSPRLFDIRGKRAVTERLLHKKELYTAVDFHEEKSTPVEEFSPAGAAAALAPWYTPGDVITVRNGRKYFQYRLIAKGDVPVLEHRSTYEA